MAAPLQPSIWFEMDLEPYPLSTTTTYRWAPRPYADAGSWKEGRLASIGPIERALSDDDGHYSASSVRVVIDDQDALIRGLLSQTTTQYFTGREGRIFLLSEAGRRASLTPRFLFRGFIQDVQLLPNRQVSIEIRDVVGSSFSSFDLDKTIGVPLTVAEHENLPAESDGFIYPMVWGEHSDSGLLDENGDPASKGMLPAIDTGDYEIDGVMWGRLLFSIGVIDIQQVYASDLAPEDVPKRALMDFDDPDLLAPRSAAWPFPDPYIETGGIRMTVIYLKGARLEQHRSGTVTVAANACGYEDVGDGSGLMINKAFYVWQHLINTFILADEGAGYRTGNWPALETYANGDPILQTSKFEDCQQQTIDWIGGDGYLAAIAIHEPTTVREVVRRFNLTFDAFLGSNHHGQIIPALIDTAASPTAGRHYRDRIDMVEMGQQTLDHEAIETKITYAYDWDADAQAFRIANQVVEDTAAAEALKGPLFGSEQELYYSRDAASVDDSRLRRLHRHVRAPRYVEVVSNYLALEDELGDRIRLTHYNGLGTNGDVNTPGFVRRHRIDGATSTLEMLDLRRVGTLLIVGEGGTANPSVGMSAPTATRTAGAITLAAGTQKTIAFKAPSVTVAGAVRAAGANVVAFKAPTAYISPTFAGNQSLSVTAPEAELLTMAYALVANTSKSTSGTSAAIDTTGATLLVVVAGYLASGASSTNFPTVSDSKSNTWNLINLRSNNTAAVAIFYAFGTSVGSGHTFTCTGGLPSFCVAAFSGSHTSFVHGISTGAGGTVTSLQPGSITPALNNCLLIAGMAYRDNTTISVNGGFTITNQEIFQSGTAVGSALAYLIQTSAAAANPQFSWTNSVVANAQMVVLRTP